MAMLIIGSDDFDAECSKLGLTPTIKAIKKPQSELTKLQNDHVPRMEEPALNSTDDLPDDLEVVEEINLAELARIEEINSARIEEIKRGRPAGKEEIPSEVREFLAQESLEGVPAKALSKLTGVSESSISAYKVGATSTKTYHEPDLDLKSHVNKVKISIGNKARGRLLHALESLTDDKIASSKARDIASIAKDMGAVVKSLEKDNDSPDNPNANIQFVFFAPKIRKEESFPIIDVDD